MKQNFIIPVKNILKPQAWLSRYEQFDITTYEKMLAEKTEKFWQQQGQIRALEIFHAAALRVPAYKKFLRKNKISPNTIRTLSDFEHVPPTDKENYIYAYPLSEHCWDGKLDSSLIASSSGTSGFPQYWPRGGYQEYEAAITHELLFKNFFGINDYKTLALVGFPMGVYVSGMATVLPSWLVSQKQYPLTVMSPGNNKAEVLKCLQSLKNNFDQLLLVGHPFFIKDVIETGKKSGIEWKKLKHLRLMFCSEGFSEPWRNYLLNETGLSTKRITAINTYGSSEMLLMAYETPLSIEARAIMGTSIHINKEILNSSYTPNLFQYNPVLRYVEQQNNEFLFTSMSGIPLIRFNLHDAGKIIPFNKISAITKTAKETNWQLPFIALWGRSDYTVIFYAANIYPQHIVSALHHKPLLPHLTGKFTMIKKYAKSMDEFLEIHIELRPQELSKKSLEALIQQRVISHLEEINMEYAFLRKHLQKDLRPRITLWPYQHELYFKPGLKPKFITNEA